MVVANTGTIKTKSMTIDNILFINLVKDLSDNTLWCWEFQELAKPEKLPYNVGGLYSAPELAHINRFLISNNIYYQNRIDLIICKKSYPHD